jgi:hypothetical protein
MTAISVEHPTGISAIQLRQQMGEVLERVHYQFQQFRIMRKDKPMARLVNEEYMQTIDQLIESDPSLADTIALMLNDEAMGIIEQGQREVRENKFIPLTEALNQK